MPIQFVISGWHCWVTVGQQGSHNLLSIDCEGRLAGNEVQVVTRQARHFGANGLKARQKLLDAEFAEGVTAVQDESLQGHWVALRAVGKVSQMPLTGAMNERIF